MDGPHTTFEYECMIATDEAASALLTDSLSPALYFEDLILHHHEEIEAAEDLLKAAENEYCPLRALSPTVYYDNSQAYESDEESDLIRLAEDEPDDSLLLTPLSLTLYYEAMASEGGNIPAMVQAYEKILGRQPAINDGTVLAGKGENDGKTTSTNSTFEHRSEELPDQLREFSGCLTVLQQPSVKILIVPSNQDSSGTLFTANCTGNPGTDDDNDHIFSEMVELVINTKKAVVHDHLLAEVSKYFAHSARQSTSQSPLSLSVRDFSPDMRWNTLLIFLKWLYFNDLYEDDDFEDSPPAWDDILDLYFLANKWEIVILKNLLLDVLIKRFDLAMEMEEFPCDYTNKIYVNTNPEEPLRRLWIDFYKGGRDGGAFQIEVKSNRLDLDFLKELSVSLLDSPYRPDEEDLPYMDDPSLYHSGDHATGDCCCRMRFEGEDYVHKSEYKIAQAQQVCRLISADRRVTTLESEVKTLKDDARAVRLELKTKKSVLRNKEEELKTRESKVKGLEAQLSKLEEAKLKSEQDKEKRLEHLQNSLNNTQNSLTNMSLSKEKDALAARSRITALEQQLQTKTKELETQKHELENQKKRKLDSDWRSGR